jgi:type IV secretion system protein VirD4
MDVIKFMYAVISWLLISLLKLVLWCGRMGWRGLRWAFRKRPTTFGSSRWGGLADAFKARLMGRHGLIIGKAWGRLLRFRGDGGLLVIAPMGAGKGVSVVIPNLLDCPGSVFCLDVKGELAAITRRDRARRGPVYELDAIHPDTSHCFNPLSLIRRDCLADDSAMIADLLVTPSGGDRHWDDAARNLIGTVIAHVLTSLPRELHTLAQVATIVAAEPSTFIATLEAMARSPVASIAHEGRACLGSIDASGNLADELKSVKRNAAKFMAIWAIDRSAGQISEGSNFDMVDLHRQTISVFVKVPEDRLSTYSSFLRVMMGCAVVAMVRAKDLPRPAHKPLLLFDECASLGRLDVLERGMGWLREYANVLSVWQSVGQLRSLYGQDGARIFLGAAGVKIVMGINDNDTANDLAMAIGHTTVATTNTGHSQASSDLLRHQQQVGASEGQRYLIDPAELQRLGANTTLLIPRGAPPFKTRKLLYYKHRAFKGRFDAWRAAAPASGLDLDALTARFGATDVGPDGGGPVAPERQTSGQWPGPVPSTGIPPTASAAAQPATA